MQHHRIVHKMFSFIIHRDILVIRTQKCVANMNVIYIAYFTIKTISASIIFCCNILTAFRLLLTSRLLNVFDKKCIPLKLLVFLSKTLNCKYSRKHFFFNISENLNPKLPFYVLNLFSQCSNLHSQIMSIYIFF